MIALFQCFSSRISRKRPLADLKRRCRRTSLVAVGVREKLWLQNLSNHFFKKGNYKSSVSGNGYRCNTFLIRLFFLKMVIAVNPG